MKTELIRIDGGEFVMGDTREQRLEVALPIHKVKINDFFLGKYTITQEEYLELSPEFLGEMSNNMLGKNYPLYNINWYEAILFCNLKSVVEGLNPVYYIKGTNDCRKWGDMPKSIMEARKSTDESKVHYDNVVCKWEANGYRLPTEAEWEFAARGGLKNSIDYLYSGSDNIDAVAHYDVSSGYECGTKLPNALGLYDMSGNFYEWCWDWFGETYYSESPFDNPKGPTNGNKRVYRGGDWWLGKNNCKVFQRAGFDPRYLHDSLSFRLCRSKL